MKRIEGHELVTLIENCLDLSMDGRLTPKRRSQMLALAKRLRGALLNLLTAEFSDDNAELKDANQKMKDVNAVLRDKIESIEKIADTISSINSLLSKLDKLLSVATGFL